MNIPKEGGAVGDSPLPRNSLVAHDIRHGEDLWGIKELIVVIILITQVTFGRAAQIWERGQG